MRLSRADRIKAEAIRQAEAGKRNAAYAAALKAENLAKEELDHHSRVLLECRDRKAVLAAFDALAKARESMAKATAARVEAWRVVEGGEPAPTGFFQKLF